MNIHEYQGKQLFQKFSIPTPKGNPAFSVEEAVDVAKKLGGPVWVVKAQIHAGGRGKAGGVKIAKSLDEVKKFASQILGMTLVTPQTGPEGKQVKRLLIEQGAQISKEFYTAVTLDRANSKLVIIASPAGGMSIEEVAHSNPEKIFKEWVNPSVGLREFQTRRLSKNMGFESTQAKQYATILRSLIDLYQSCDCSLAEINPLVLTADGNLIAVDAKLNFDDNAMYRHPEFTELVDPNEEDPNEAQAKKFDLSYVSLDGSIGCMVNGAGLAMGTMDIIKLEGGFPANFLDVGGSASEEKVTEAFKIILQDEKVKAILVNIFGGIMKCDIIAGGIISAAKQLHIKVPLVVRLEGTNVEQGKKLLKDSGLKIIAASDLGDAAKKAVASTRGNA